MTTIDIDQVNRERRRKGLPPLSREQAYSAVRERVTSSRSDDSGFDTIGFLIGYTTGIPMPSAGGLMGALMHPTDHSSPSSSATSRDDYSGSGGSFGGAGASGSWESSSSSSSSDSSSSSSSSDSGSSSSSSSE